MSRRQQPDLTLYSLPDPQELHARDPLAAMSLREGQGDGEYEWPESGPSEVNKGKGLGPFGAKAVAAMTGAVATSLLSAWSSLYFPKPPVLVSCCVRQR